MRSLLKASSVFFALWVSVVVGVVRADLTADLAAKEAALDSIALTAEASHQSRCATLSTCTDTCNVYACGNDFPTDRGFHCNSTFGTDTALCGTDCNGLVRSMSTSVVRFPPGVSKTDPETQAFVCASKSLDVKFQEKLDTTMVLKAWSYIGHYTGSIRIYPGNPQTRDDDDETCSTYDARLRPWFIAASSGPKDIVIILDSSLSMLNAANSAVSNGQSRLDAVKAAVVALLGTLTQNDYVNVIHFGTSTTVVGSDTTALLQGNAENILALQNSVNNILASGNTVMAPAFTKAFELLGGSSETTSGCTRVVLFLTDGQSTDSTTTTASNNLVLNTINASQSGLAEGRKAHVFTYSMSSAADHTLPQAIACENNGVWANIVDGEDPLTQMRGYYQFLAMGGNTTQVRWTTPYIDDFGLGQMVTAARPLYDYSKPVPLMVGVVGADITIEELEAGGSDFNTIVSALILRSKTCSILNLTECDYQQLRVSSGYTCPTPAPTIDTCSSEKVVQSECTAVSGKDLDDYMCGNDISYSTTRTVSSGFQTDQETTCCGSCENLGAGGTTVEEDDSGGLEGGTIAIIIVLVVIVVIIFIVSCLVSSVNSKPSAAEQRPTSSTNNNSQAQAATEEVSANQHQTSNSVNQAAATPPSYPQYPQYPPNNNGGAAQPAHNIYPPAPPAGGNGYPAPSGYPAVPQQAAAYPYPPPPQGGGAYPAPPPPTGGNPPPAYSGPAFGSGANNVEAV